MAGGHGGKRKGAGRKPGSRNKAPRRPNKSALSAEARAYSTGAIGELAKLGGIVRGVPGAVSEMAQVKALKAILNRGYGEPGRVVDLVVSPGIGASLTDAELERIAAGGVVTQPHQTNGGD
jgi:hypothetical protein